jgi:hypothetical protein
MTDTDRLAMSSAMTDTDRLTVVELLSPFGQAI